MKSLKWMLLIALAACSSPKKVEETSKKAVGFTPRKHEELVLENGLRVILLQDDKLPYFAVSLLIKSGALEDPQGKDGLANMTATLLEKGTRGKSAQVIAQKLGRIAAEFEGDVSHDYSYFKSSSLAKDQNELMGLFSELIQEPSFPKSEIARVRSETLSYLEKSADNPGAFTDRAFDYFLFPDSGYGRPSAGTMASIRVITRADIQNFYDQNYRPNNSWLAVVGQLRPDIKEVIKETFGHWAPKEVKHLAQKPPSKPEGINLRLVDKPELVQTQLRFGHLGVARNHPDYLPLRLANTILGSGFSSRLVNRVRDQLGLTYHISSSVDAFLEAGSFEIRTFTQNARVADAIRETLATYREFYEKGPSNEEVQEAKSFLIGQFPQVIETAEAWAFNLLVLRLHGMPDTYLTQFPQNVASITPERVREVIASYMRPSDLKILAFSTSKDVLTQMNSISQKVEVKPYKDFQ